MSIIVGVDCSDCVILAVSGPGPRSAKGQPEAAEPLIGELRAVAGQAVVGYSGPEELGREVAAAMERYVGARDPRELAPEEHCAGIHAAVSQPVRLATDMNRALEGLPGGGGSKAGLTSAEMLIALPCKNRYALYAVSGECAVGLVDRGFPCAAIGQGKAAAESFLRFLQRLLWREGGPSRAAAQLAAYWTARHVSDIEGGSSRTIQVVRVGSGAGQVAEIAPYGERVIASLRRAVDEANDQIRSEIKRRVLIDFEALQDEPATTLKPPVRRRVPEVRVTLHPRKDDERKPKW